MSATEKIMDTAQKKPLGIIAGRGGLPYAVRDAALADGRSVYIAALKNSAEESLCDGFDHGWYNLGAGGSILKAFKKRGIEEIVMIGGVQRPNFSDIRPDLWTAGILTKIGLKALGDNDLLVTIKLALEKEGLRVMGAHQVAPRLITPVGVLGKYEPNERDQEDIERGVAVAQALGAVDVGQSVIVYDGLVLGVEAIEGTDALIERCASYRKKERGGLLVKLCKPQQDKSLDMPTIGLRTLENLYDHGFDGLAVHAGNSLMPEREAIIEFADNRKLFVLGVDA